MYRELIINGIAYAEGQRKLARVVSVHSLDDFLLLLRFDSGEKGIYDVKPLLDSPAFASLKDKKVFMVPIPIMGQWSGMMVPLILARKVCMQRGIGRK